MSNLLSQEFFQRRPTSVPYIVVNIPKVFTATLAYSGYNVLGWLNDNNLTRADETNEV